jgi:hypothetical protein
MGPRPPRWCPGAAIKTAANIQTDYSYCCHYTYFLNDVEARYGLAVFTIGSTRPRKLAERVNGASGDDVDIQKSHLPRHTVSSLP